MMCPDSIWKIVWLGDRRFTEEFVEAQSIEQAIEKWKRLERAMPSDNRIVSISIVEVIK